METLLRQWTMLRSVPRAPRRIDTTTLVERLAEQGYEVSKRTVERDLRNLSTSWLFPLFCDDRSTPYGWYWGRQAEPLDIPGMEPQTALAFQLAKRYLEPLMAPSTLAALRPYFKQAASTLERAPEPVARWPEKVRILSRHFRLKPPEADEDVLNVVYQALLEERRFRVRYRPRRNPEIPRDYVVNPLGLVLRDQVSYLIASLWDYDNVVHLVPHRMEEAELLDEPTTPPGEFDLDAYLADERLDFPAEETIGLDLRMDAEVAKHLAETPLSDDQRMDEEDDHWSRITATVIDTQPLRWWLLAFGPRVEVLGPPQVREWIARELREAVGLYR